MLQFDPTQVGAIAKKKRVSRERLAEIANVDRRTIIRWLNEKPHHIPAYLLPAFADELRCGIMDFFTYK